MSLHDFLPKLSERVWASHVDGLAKMLKWAMWRDNATNAPRQCPRCKLPINLPRNEPGWPDRIYLRGDTLLVVEFKSDSGRVRPEQQAWLDAFSKVRRVVVAVWRPKDRAAVHEALQ